MLDFEELYHFPAGGQLKQWLQELPAQIEGRFGNRHGEFDKWYAWLKNLPQVETEQVDFNQPFIPVRTTEILDAVVLREQLMQFHPWRKGPYEINQVLIDTEWRSDFKWDRLHPHISDLTGRYVLDIGCGNGYHCWRMYGAGAKLVIGMDPSWMFLIQFQVIKHFAGKHPVYVLPLGVEDIKANLAAFDTVFSMGVLYHRRSPIDFLLALKSALKPGGELVLETLVITEEKGQLLLPEDRYAKMRNVWFIPSPAMLTRMLERCGFENPRVVDINQTTFEEQHATEWMRNESLSDFLDPADPDKTIEGYPAPTRAIVIARNPF